MPSTGKSSFYSNHFKSEGYLHINQDTIGSRAKCVKAVEEAIKEGKSCVIGALTTHCHQQDGS
jgi:bifunctional polynucleotide phosphatase/kinase